MSNSIIQLLKDEYNQSDQRPFDITHLFYRLMSTRDNTRELNNLIDGGMDLIYPDSRGVMEVIANTSSELLVLAKLMPIDDTELIISINCRRDVIEVLVNREIDFKIDEWSSPCSSADNHVNVFYNYRYLTQPPQIPTDDYCWYIALIHWNLPFEGNIDRPEDCDDQLIIKVGQYYAIIYLHYIHHELINRLSGLNKLTCKRIQKLMWRDPPNHITGRCPYIDLLIYVISKLPDGTPINVDMPSCYYNENRLN